MTAEELYEKLMKTLKSYHPSNDFAMIEKAYLLAKQAHEKQLRRSGEPYIIHPLSVAIILAELELDIETIVAGILHDIIEDTEYTYQDIVNMFSEEIALLVDGVTKLGKIAYSTKEEQQAENYRKMFLAMAKDIRVILIKLADRLHNMRTLKFMTPQKQKEIAQETLDIYAPLAHRLGISKLRYDIEDLSLRYIDSDAYYDLAEKIERKQSERVIYVENIVSDLKKKLEEAEIEGTVDGRPKHFFSIYKKMHNQDKTLDQIYDLFAVRVIVDSVRDCYEVLGIVHEMYKPIQGRFKDYIAMPKANMYQSLHNTLIGPEGEPFEVQIRTWEMHRTSEYGIAAHWKYKETKSGEVSPNAEEEKLAWLRQILEWQRDLSDNREFMDALKLDLNVFNDNVYCFTPTGEVISLPSDSTPIDFAYTIHSAVGNKMIGAKANGKIVTFDYKINNGDRIEVITSQNSRGPSRDWLKLVKSSHARNKINQWFKKENKIENTINGKDLLEKDAKKKGLNTHELYRTEWLNIVLNKYGFQDWDSLCAAVGHGGIKEGQIINRLHEELIKEQKKNNPMLDLIKPDETVHINENRSKSGIVVKGVGDISVRFSKCCNPVPGDEIIGFVTRGRGVSIHRTDCVNIINLDDENRNRLMEAEWQVGAKSENQACYLTEIKITTDDRMGIIMDISRVLTEEEIAVKALNARTYKSEAVFNVVIEIKNKAQLEKLTKKFKHISGIHEIERVTT